MTRKLLALMLLLPALSLGVVACGSSDSESGGSDSEMTDSAQMNEKNIVEVAADTPDLATLVQAVTAAGLGPTLEGPGPFTVFAPTNAAFKQLPPGELDRLLEPANKDELANILKYHVASGEVMSSDLSNGQKIETLQGDSLTVKIEGGKVMIGDATVSQADVMASNGVVHVIDKVLLPPQ